MTYRHYCTHQLEVFRLYAGQHCPYCGKREG